MAARADYLSANSFSHPSTNHVGCHPFLLFFLSLSAGKQSLVTASSFFHDLQTGNASHTSGIIRLYRVMQMLVWGHDPLKKPRYYTNIMEAYMVQNAKVCSTLRLGPVIIAVQQPPRCSPVGTGCLLTNHCRLRVCAPFAVQAAQAKLVMQMQGNVVHWLGALCNGDSHPLLVAQLPVHFSKSRSEPGAVWTPCFPITHGYWSSLSNYVLLAGLQHTLRLAWSQVCVVLVQGGEENLNYDVRGLLQTHEPLRMLRAPHLRALDLLRRVVYVRVKNAQMRRKMLLAGNVTDFLTSSAGESWLHLAAAFSANPKFFGRCRSG